tara:strand:- start:139 stop:318 length:180 start_codon:yes stop_codon:yes gene_type:complete
MRKIRINYTLEVDDNKFDKARNLVRLDKRVFTDDIKKTAEINGRVSVYNKIETLIGKEK